MITALVYGSVRDGRRGIRLVQYLEHLLTERGHEVVTVDPDRFPMPLLERRLVEYEIGTAPASIEQVGDLFSSAEGFVFVTGEYNYSVPPALSNIIDHFGDEFRRKCAAIAGYSYGPYGGVRAIEQLRSMLAAVGLVTSPVSLPVATVQETLGEDGTTDRSDLDEAATRFVREFEWYTDALTSARSRS